MDMGEECVASSVYRGCGCGNDSSQIFFMEFLLRFGARSSLFLLSVARGASWSRMGALLGCQRV